MLNGSPPVNYPSRTLDHPTIEKSNTGTCSTGGAACVVHADCSVGDCEDVEGSLELGLITDSIGDFEIKTESTTASVDSLRILFGSATSSNTMTCESLRLDATNGPVTIYFYQGASLETH